MPIGLLVYLHHKSFKEEEEASDESDAKSNGTQRKYEVNLSPRLIDRIQSYNSEKNSNYFDQ